MKCSGVEWIGDIPDDWETYRIGSLFLCRNEKVNDTDYPPLSVSKGGIVPQIETVAKSDANDNRKLVLKDDFVINSRSDRKQSCGLSQLNGSVSLINTVLIISNKDILLPKYTNYLLKNYGFAEEFYRWGHGIVADLWTTRWQEMKSILIALPNTTMQQKIAEYLDKKCGQVDGLIANQQAQIEKLKQYKQSVITEAVTRGLNPSAPLKYSGIDWIGNIPEHWKASRVGRHYNITLGKMLCTSKTTNDYTLEKYFCAANVHFDGITINESLKEMWFSPEEKSIYLVKNGDLLVVEGGAGAGGCSVVCCINDNVYVQNSIMIVRSKKSVDNRFLKYHLESLVKQNYIDIVCNKATIPHFTKDKLANTPFVLPPLEEQQQIADYLDNKCGEIDRLISLKQQKIDALTSYKKSLIYEYVTGKKEVI